MGVAAGGREQVDAWIKHLGQVHETVRHTDPDEREGEGGREGGSAPRNTLSPSVAALWGAVGTVGTVLRGLERLALGNGLCAG